MPLSKKQLVRLVWLVAQLKENRYPNCSRFSEVMRQAALDEKLNVACTSKTIFRDIQSFKNDFDASIRFDRVRNGYYLAHHGWNFSFFKNIADKASKKYQAGLRGELQEMFNAKTLQDARKKRDEILESYRDVAESAMNCLDEGFESAMTAMIRSVREHSAFFRMLSDGMGFMPLSVFESCNVHFFWIYVAFFVFSQKKIAGYP